MPFAALVSTSSASVICTSLVALENGMEFICILRWHFLGTFASVRATRVQSALWLTWHVKTALQDWPVAGFLVLALVPEQHRTVTAQQARARIQC
jgi:hypothetical protein